MILKEKTGLTRASDSRGRTTRSEGEGTGSAWGRWARGGAPRKDALEDVPAERLSADSRQQLHRRKITDLKEVQGRTE